MPARKQKSIIDTLLPLLPHAIWMAVLGTVYGVLIYSNTATKPWVEEGLANQKKYTDERIIDQRHYFDEKLQAVGDKVTDHSDMNFQKMNTQQQTTAAKLDMLTDLIRDLRDSKANKK